MPAASRCQYLTWSASAKEAALASHCTVCAAAQAYQCSLLANWASAWRPREGLRCGSFEAFAGTAQSTMVAISAAVCNPAHPLVASMGLDE